MAKSTENEYPAEATIGDQWRRGKIANRLSFSGAELHRRISQVAYEHYLRRGKVHGHDLDDWVAAERKVKAHGG
jgi:Protein of unknown function (DUF2934)